MPGLGRNDPCSCGSGRKVKRCCGQQRGPSEAQLARAHVALLARDAALDIAGRSDDALDELWDGMFDLPAVDISLLVALPRLIGPELQHLREAMADDDPDWDVGALVAVAEQVDTPVQRARLADALVRLRDQRRITRHQAAAAILDLDSRSRRFIAASLLEAIALSAGAVRTPGGLQIAA
ncbi:MAG: SEC-C metal-binding domain-containing protein [Solirubrobacteraceae bacterium]